MVWHGSGLLSNRDDTEKLGGSEGLRESQDGSGKKGWMNRWSPQAPGGIGSVLAKSWLL